MIPVRMDLYELPGLYYNGTLTITHKLTQNSAWDTISLAKPGAETCANNDETQKTYEYPALFFIGPKGNDSDTNPVHWALRAYQPTDQMTGSQYLDVSQRWVHIRSSDFVVTDGSLKSSIFGQYQYFASDATRMHRETRVYWDTAVTATGGDTYSATASYVAQPSEVGLNDLSYGLLDEGTGPRSSQYVTLSDVCYYGQEMYAASDVSVPRSKIPKDNQYLWDTRPAVMLPLGAEASITEIGAKSMSLTMNTTVSSQLAFVNPDEATCSAPTYGWLSYENTMYALQWSKARWSHSNLWNISASIDISFKGDMVTENSTTIKGLEDGQLVFAETYERTYDNTTGSSGNGASALDLGWGMFVISHVALLWLSQ